MNDAALMMKFHNDSKSVGVSYLLWFLLGTFGAHRFYLRRPLSATALLLMTIVGFFGAGAEFPLAILLVPVIIWVFVDLFLIPGMVRQHNESLRLSLMEWRR